MSKLDADRRNDLNKGEFAFPKQRKEPLEDARHVRNAIARFDQVRSGTVFDGMLGYAMLDAYTEEKNVFISTAGGAKEDG